MFIKKHAVACIILLSGSLTAAAAPVIYDFTAELQFAQSQLSGDLVTSNGGSLSGTFIYDADAPITVSSPALSRSAMAITDFNFDLGTTSGLINISMQNDNVMSVVDGAWSYSRGTVDAIALPLVGHTLFSANFIITTMNALASSLPNDLSSFEMTDANGSSSSIFDLLFADFRGAGRQARYDITSITARNITPPPSVPEPAPLALLGLGLVGLGLIKRRKVTS